MTIKIYVTIHPDEQLTFSNAPQIVDGGRTYSFELNLPSPIEKIEIDPDTIHEHVAVPDDEITKEAHDGVFVIPPAKIVDPRGREVTN